MKRLLVTLVVLLAIAFTARAQWDFDQKYAADLVKSGSVAPYFRMKTAEGKTLSLNQYKGRYVLLDFWASWCPDCRKDIPNVVRMYRKFHPQGVDFIGISMDTNAEAWKKAIAQYGLTYPQVSELVKFHDTKIAALYGVKWIPSMVLIDPQGKVLLSTVLSYKMERTLTELMTKEHPASVSGTTDKLTLMGSKGKLAAEIQKPVLSSGEKVPIAIIMHGFTGNKEGRMLKLIADSLQNHGIASIRFDFNGHGQSEGRFEDMTVPNEIEDAKKVYEYVATLPYVDASRIALVGHSQGGVVSAMTAGELGSPRVAAVALLAPAAVLRDDAIRGNTMGAKYNPLDPPDSVPLFGGHNLGASYIRTAFTLPIYETAARYTGPATIIHGTGDRVVPYTYGERFHEQWKNSEWHLLEYFDHGFTQNVYRVAELTSEFLTRTLGK
ncbi:MAG: alpha/beta fold hydrolase [Prevotella sp.]|jgi:pimeloyl-ACP methyl ester carboxylesterase/peroxiredoxin|nr:alpha/beta fold hydrolase [Prevotella sp.]